MISLIVGIIFCAFTVFAALPEGLGWGAEIILYLKGAAPSLAVLIGLVAIFMGISDLKDKSEAKKEEQEAIEKDT